MCGLTKHKVKMDRDSDATEIEDESLSLHLYFSGEDSASLLSGTPKVRFCFVFSFLFQCFKISSLLSVLIVTLVL